MDTFSMLSPDGHAIEVWSLPNVQGGGSTHRERVHNNVELEKFIARYDHPGRALYHTVAKLKDGMTRSKEAVETVCFIWADIDFKDHPDVLPEEIRRRVEAIPTKPTLVVFSGHGLHLYWRLNEPENAAPGEGQKIVEEALKLACNYVGGDPSVAETARLMRLPGSHNTRNKDERIPVTVAASNDLTYEMDDLVDFWLEARPILPARPPAQEKTNGHSADDFENDIDAPVDVDACFEAMTHQGEGATSVNGTLKRVIPSLLGRGEHWTTFSPALSNKSWRWRHGADCSGTGRLRPNRPSSAFSVHTGTCC